MAIKRVSLFLHVRDSFHGELFDENGKLIHSEDGYVPDWLPGGPGDDVDLVIDNETGRILNWKPIKESDLEFEGDDDFDFEDDDDDEDDDF